MEATREIYWNVGHGVLLPMYLFTLIAFAALGYGFYRRVEVYRRGRGLHRLDHLGLRLQLLVENLFGQFKVLRVTGPGLTHALFFWGFLLLFIGTLLVMLQADFTQPLFDLVILKGTFYKIFSLVLDLAGLVAIVTLLGLALRRFLVKPEGLQTIRDDYLAHLLLTVILVTGFLVEGARMAVTELGGNPDLARFSPVGLLVAKLLSGLEEQSLRDLHRGGWWFHFILVIGFIIYIPVSKLRHLFTTPANYLIADLREKGSIDTINLEEEGVERFGVEQIPDLYWKDIFDADACTSCKRCQDRCPAWATDKPLSPMRVVQQIGEVAFGDPRANLVDTVTRDVLWACTTCRACQEICPADIEHVNKILDMRRSLALMQGDFPGDEITVAFNNYEVNGNPFGLAYAGRADWSEGLGIGQLCDGAEADVLYFVGCYASFDRRNKEVARSFARICNAVGVRLAILGKEEKCCGEPARKLGNEYLYQMMARENIELIKGYGVKKIVATCPHCLNTIGRDYRDLGLDIEVEHYTVFLDRLIKEGRLLIEAKGFDYTYHDSCYIGRYKDLFEEPRGVLAAAGGRLSEMEKARYESFCCGGGGGRILAEEKLGSRICEARAKMAHATGAPLLVSNCPFCLTMFEDGIKTGELEGKLKVRDLAEIVAERLDISTPPDPTTPRPPGEGQG